MKGGIIKALLVTGALLFAGSQVASGAEITIWDGVGTGPGWYGEVEDDEVEPNCVANQFWDLERFYLTGTTLRLTGGWNFRNGYGGNASGDIFIDVNGGAVYGQDRYTQSNSNGNLPDSNAAYGYDYVIHFTGRGDQSIGDGSYQVYELNDESTLTTPFYRQNDASGPWVYSPSPNGDGELVAVGGTAIFGQAGQHYIMDVDVGFLGDVSDALFKFTMECGNDNMIGRGNVSVPDGGLTAVLLGMGLVSMAAIKRRLEN